METVLTGALPRAEDRQRVIAFLKLWWGEDAVEFRTLPGYQCAMKEISSYRPRERVPSTWQSVELHGVIRTYVDHTGERRELSWCDSPSQVVFDLTAGGRLVTVRHFPSVFGIATNLYWPSGREGCSYADRLRLGVPLDPDEADDGLLELHEDDLVLSSATAPSELEGLELAHCLKRWFWPDLTIQHGYPADVDVELEHGLRLLPEGAAWTNHVPDSGLEFAKAWLDYVRELRPYQQRATASRRPALYWSADPRAYPIDHPRVEFSVRATNCLQRGGYHVLGEVVRCTRVDLLKLRGMNVRALYQLEQQLARLGLRLRDGKQSSP